MRTVAAIAIAPLAVIPTLTALFGPWALTHGGARSLAGIVMPSAIVAYPLLVLFGLPMHIALTRAGYTRTRDYALSGLLLGAVPVIGYLIVAVVFEAKFVLSAMPAALARNVEWGAIGAAVFALCGGAIAAAFAWIIRGGTPVRARAT